MNPRYAVVAARAGHRCEYCRAPEAAFNLAFEVEHVVPPGAGGNDEDSNLALACRSCNLFKADRLTSIDPRTNAAVSLFSPRLSNWDAHFQVLEDSQVIGRSPVGRATAAQLRMNSFAQLRARIQWMKLGMYP